MHLQLAYILAFFVLGGPINVFAVLFLTSLVRPRRPSREKLTTYECAEVPIGSGWFRLNLRFYTVALIFIVFDAELITILPVATVYRDWVAASAGPQAFYELFLFIGILLIGLAYVWRKGDLEWFKQINADERVDEASASRARGIAATDRAAVAARTEVEVRA